MQERRLCRGRIEGAGVFQHLILGLEQIQIIRDGNLRRISCKDINHGGKQ